MTTDPQNIGRYEILRVLGRGAMGVVYLAQDPLLKRTVAIKTLRELSADRHEVLVRFQREAEISARLNHPNIITVFDVGETPDHGPFLAMEFVDGLSLAPLIKEGIPPETTVRLLLQLAKALEAAEAAGIIHRDIKPDNILVSRDGRLKLMDFGIAREGETRMTKAGIIFGTPAYWAPEMLVGGEASHDTDRYAFAITAFEMLSGDIPFQSSSVGTTIYKIVHDPPILPDAFSDPLKSVFLKALAKEPGDRYPNLRTFLAALVEALELTPDVKVRLQAQLFEDDPLLATGAWAALSIPPAPAPNLSTNETVLLRSDSHLEMGDPSTTAAPPSPDELSFLLEPPVLPEHTVGTGDEPELQAAAALLLAQISSAKAPPPEPLVPDSVSAFSTQCMPVPLPPEATRTTQPDPEPPVQVDKGEQSPLSTQAQELAHLPPQTPTVEAAPRVSGPDEQTPRKRPFPLLLGAGGLLVATLAVAFFALRPQKARAVPTLRLDISSEPPGAEVLSGKQRLGQTPLRGIDLPPGVRELRFELEGFEPALRAIVPSDHSVQVVLERIAHTIPVITDPPGAEVFLDGRPVGRSPIASLPIPKGSNPALLIRKPGYEEWTTRVDPDLPFPNPIILNRPTRRR